MVEFDERELERFDAAPLVIAEENTRGLAGIDPDRTAIVERARGPLARRFVQRAAAAELRWCVTLFPTAAHAQDAGMAQTDVVEASAARAVTPSRRRTGRS